MTVRSLSSRKTGDYAHISLCHTDQRISCKCGPTSPSNSVMSSSPPGPPTLDPRRTHPSQAHIRGTRNVHGETSKCSFQSLPWSHHLPKHLFPLVPGLFRPPLPLPCRILSRCSTRCSDGEHASRRPPTRGCGYIFHFLRTSLRINTVMSIIPPSPFTYNKHVPSAMDVVRMESNFRFVISRMISCPR